MVVLLAFVGVYYTFKLDFIQIRKLPFAIKTVFCPQKNKNSNNNLTPFEALSTALGGTMGTGNIVGVGAAIVIGGAGAVFWMWISAFLGMVIKYVEVYLAVYYKQQNSRKVVSGGPMYYIEKGLGRNYRGLAVIFAIGTVISSFGIGNITQVNAVTTQIESGYNISPIVTSLFLFVPVCLVCIADYTSTGTFTAKLVPLMTLVYMIMSGIVLFKNISLLPRAFYDILTQAFSFKSTVGGVIGYSFSMAVRLGFSRGIFSNEAGMGSSPIAHGSSNGSTPHIQGLYGIFEVFADTIVMCTVTALVVLTCSDKVGLQNAEMPVTFAMSQVFGDTISVFLLSVCIVVFAYTSILGWCFYGCKCCEYLFGEGKTLIYKTVFCIFIVIGAFFDMSFVWNLSDILNLFMAVPNLIAITLLHKKIKKQD